MLADGTTNQYKVADITVDTPYYNGKLEAVCMKRSLYNLIIGNIPGAKYPCLGKQIEAISADIIPVDIPDNSNKKNPTNNRRSDNTCPSEKCDSENSSLCRTKPNNWCDRA